MFKNRFLRVSLLIFFFFFVILIFFFQNKFSTKKEYKTDQSDEILYKANIIKDVKYSTTDADGNNYIILASEGEIDFSEPNILYLTKVKAIITLKNLEIVKIVSDYGKYNSENLDTIFSKNVIIDYLENNITGEYLDFSLNRNSLIISRNVVYKNLNNILKADVLEMNVKTKDTKIYMYEENKKINVQNKL